MEVITKSAAASKSEFTEDDETIYEVQVPSVY